MRILRSKVTEFARETQPAGIILNHRWGMECVVAVLGAMDAGKKGVCFSYTYTSDSVIGLTLRRNRQADAVLDLNSLS